MKIAETFTGSAGVIEHHPDIDQPRAQTIGSFRFRNDIVRLHPIPYADAEPTVLHIRPEVNEFMLTKPA